MNLVTQAIGSGVPAGFQPVGAPLQMSERYTRRVYGVKVPKMSEPSPPRKPWMVAVVPLKNFTFDGRQFAAGEKTMVPPIDAAVLTYKKLASFAPKT